MFTALKRLFCMPSAEDLAKRELRVARLDLLEAQRGVDYHSAMVRYNEQRIARLSVDVTESNFPDLGVFQ